MADQLYLSCWVRGFTEHNMLRHFEKLLRTFPHSRLSRDPATLKITPVDFSVPALLERPFEQPLQVSDAIVAAKEFLNPDCCYQLDTAWDLWQYDDKEWSVGPSRAALLCFGPQFEKDLGENLRVDFGVDANFLPAPDLAGSAKMTEANIRSLLRLVHDIDDLPGIEQRRLLTESGENFAERLQQVLSDSA